MTQDTPAGKRMPTIEELETALLDALANKRTRTQQPTYTYWVRAVLVTKLGTVTAKVAYGPGAASPVNLVLPSEPGHNFSSKEYAEELALRAAGSLEDQLVGASITLWTEVVRED